MSLNLDLCRRFLIALDAGANDGERDAQLTGCGGSDNLETQIRLLTEAGLVRSLATESATVPADGPGVALTPSGREFLRLTRNDAIWKRACSELAAGKAPVTLQAVRARVLEWGQFS